MKGKRKIAAFLTAVMLLSTAGTSYAQSNFLGKPRQANDEGMIEVTLDANGGVFLDAGEDPGTATPSTASNSKAAKASSSNSTKVVMLDVDGTDAGGYEYAIWEERPEYEVEYKTERSERQFAGWYRTLKDISTKAISGETYIYNKTTLKAKWMSPEGFVVGEAADEYDIMVEKLNTVDPDAALVVQPLLGDEMKSESELKAAALKLGLKIDAKNAVQLDFDVEGGVIDPVTILMNVPDELDPERPIWAIHYAKTGVEKIPVEVDMAGEKMTFTLSSFSPVIFVNGEDGQKIPEGEVTLTVKNVPGGYLFVTEGERSWEPEKIYPIGEEVKIPAGTEVWIAGRAYSYYKVPENKRVKFAGVTAVTESGKQELKPEEVYDDRFVVTEDTVLEGKFELEDITDGSKGDLGFYIEFDPERLDKPGIYKGKVVRVYNEMERKDVPLSQVQLALSGYGTEGFEYNDTTRELTSKEALPYGGRGVEFDVTYQGKTYEGSGNGYIEVGYSVSGYIVMAKADNNSRSENWAFENIEGGITVKEALETLNGAKGEPFMYNYEFAGWADRNGKLYNKEDMTKLSQGLSVYAVFKKSDKLYVPAKMIAYGEIAPETPNKPSTGGSSSSSGGSANVRGVSRAMTENPQSYILKGNWEQTAQGWKFKADNGSYAAGRWAMINNNWYFFNDQGVMLTGWNLLSNKWFYLNPDPATVEGRMLTGWQQINGKWYYLNPESDGNKGAMAENTWIGDWYVDASGAWIPEKTK